MVANESSKWTMTPSILTKLWTSPDLNSTEFVGRSEEACASKEAYNPDSVTPALSGGMGQNSPNLLWEACGRLHETFESNYLKAMLPNTN